jgi:hypothetical protein
MIREPGVCLRCGLQKTVNKLADAASGEPKAAGAVADAGAVPLAIRCHGAKAILDGAQDLQELLHLARYPSLEHAIAKYAVFLHPDTVAQTLGDAVFPVVRCPLHAQRGEERLEDGRIVRGEDNGPPTKAFLWAARRRKGPDVQFNHVWTAGDAPSKLYTALWNLCATPAFLAKTTDTNKDVKALLRYHAYDLYGRRPAGEPIPPEPEGYSKLQWAPFPTAVQNLKGVYYMAMRSAPKNRATNAARDLGWLFSDWKPDKSLPMV